MARVPRSRRSFLKRAVVLATGALAAACAPAAPTVPTVAPKPTEAPSAAPKPVAAEATKPATGLGPAPVAPIGPPPTPGPSGLALQAVAAMQKPKSPARINGRFQVLQNQDFHPDHNAFVRLVLEEWGKAQSWPMDISYVSGFQGGGDINQKLLALVQSGTPPDLMDHSVDHRQQSFLGVLDPVSDVVKDLEAQHGKANPGMTRAANYDGQWWGVPYYERAGGWYVRLDWFKEAGLDPAKDLETIVGTRDAAMKISAPDRKRWGWGMTVNRSGDGESLVRLIGYTHGARIQDKDGQRATIDTPQWAAALEFIRETYQHPQYSKMLPPGVNGWNDISNNEAFLAGTLGVTDNAGTMLAKAYFDNVPHAQSIAFVKRPRADLGRGPIPQSGGGETIRMLKGTKNRDAAFDTIKFWVSKEVQRTIWQISTAYALPAYVGGWEDPVVKASHISMAYRDVAFNADWDGDYTPGPRTPAMGALLGSTLFTDMASAVLGGKTAKQAAEEAQRRAVKTFKEFGLAGE